LKPFQRKKGNEFFFNIASFDLVKSFKRFLFAVCFIFAGSLNKWVEARTFLSNESFNVLVSTIEPSAHNHADDPIQWRLVGKTPRKDGQPILIPDGTAWCVEPLSPLTDQASEHLVDTLNNKIPKEFDEASFDSFYDAFDWR